MQSENGIYSVRTHSSLCRIVALKWFFCSCIATLTFCWRRFQIKWRKRYKSGKFFFSLLQKLISTLKSKHEWRFPLKVLILYYWKSGFYLNCTCSLFPRISFIPEILGCFLPPFVLTFPFSDNEKTLVQWEIWKVLFFDKTLFLFLNRIPFLDFYSDY